MKNAKDTKCRNSDCYACDNRVKHGLNQNPN